MRDDNIWIFNAGESFAGNPKWYFLYLDKYHKEIKKYWFCYDRKTLHTVRRLGFKSCMFNSLTAKKIGRKAGVYVVDQCKEVFQDYLKGIKILNLWHGVGCKKIEAKITSPLLKERITKKYIKNSSFYQNNQKLLVTSDFMKDHFIKFCNLKESQIIKSTYPNNLSFNTPLASKIQKIFSDRNLSYALYAPTYRDNESSCNFFTAIPDINKLIKVLQKTNTRLILKMHPRIAKEANYLKAKAKYSKNKYLCFWDNQYDIYEIMDKIDFAIIDYSSIFYDLMAKGVKKFIRYLYDFEQVYKDTDFEYNPLEYTYGKLCCDFDSLLKAIEESNFEENADEYNRIYNLFWGYKNNFSSSIEAMEEIFNSIKDFKIKKEELETLYSFDIFDTLITRSCLEPKGVFYYIQDKLRKTTLEFPPYLKQYFFKIRPWCEANCREYYNKSELYRKSDTREITFDMIYDRMQEVYKLTDRQKETLKEWELECEYEASIPVKENIEVLKSLVKDNKKVVLISDMYLKESFIKKLLAKSDPVLAELPLFLSSTYGYQKTTKKLFYKVFDELNYRYKEWIHYGDNLNADIRQPSKIAIKVQQVFPLKFNKYEEELKNFINTYDAYQVSRLLSVFRNEKTSDKKTLHTKEEIYAYCYIALHFVPYVAWVIKDAIEKGFQTLYFISRDGYHLKRIADEYIAEKKLSIKTKYIYASRKTLRIPAFIEKVDDEFFSEFGNFSVIENYDELIKNSSLTEKEFNSLFPELSYLKNQKYIFTDEQKKLRQFFSNSKEYKSLLLQKAKEERRLICNYLKQEIDFTEKYAFVEYWGRGYTQKSLATLIDFILNKKTPDYTYYARSIYPTQENCIRYNFTANNYSQIPVETLFANIPYKTISSYKTTVDNKIEPVLEENSKCNKALFKAEEKYLVQFTSDFAKLNFFDEDSIFRSLWNFEISYFHNNQNDFYIKNIFSTLVDDISINQNLSSYAPPVTFKDAFFALKGIRLPTKDIKKSIKKSNIIIRIAYKLYKKYKC